MNQNGWMWQGRQGHGWFGHGTKTRGGPPPGGGRSGGSVPIALEERIRAVGSMSVAGLPHSKRRHPAAGHEGAALDRLVGAMRAWAGAGHLDDASFAAHFLGRHPSSPVVRHLRRAAELVRTAATSTDIREATDELAAGMLDVGLDGWPRFLVDAHARATAPWAVPGRRPHPLLVPVQAGGTGGGGRVQVPDRGEPRTTTPGQDATGRPTPVTADQLRAIMPGAGGEADRYVEPLNQAMAAHGINTPAQRAAFLAQVSVESGRLQHTVENLDYSARRLTQVWPRRFPTEAAARPYAHNPEALANRVYADRLGNGDEASGDGFRFRGRGLMQVTGRDNYRRPGFEDNPDALSEPQNAANTAAAFWGNNGLNAQAGALNRAQFDAVSRTVNGGNHGLQERWDAYQRALAALGVGR